MLLSWPTRLMKDCMRGESCVKPLQNIKYSDHQRERLRLFARFGWDSVKLILVPFPNQRMANHFLSSSCLIGKGSTFSVDEAMVNAWDGIFLSIAGGLDQARAFLLRVTLANSTVK